MRQLVVACAQSTGENLQHRPHSRDEMIPRRRRHIGPRAARSRGELEHELQVRPPDNAFLKEKVIRELALVYLLQQRAILLERVVRGETWIILRHKR